MNNDDLLKNLNILFGSYRAEWLRGKVFDFFTEPFYFTALKDNRPCVLQGGRGTGKTTVLKGLSYQGQFALHKKSIEQFDKNDFIGIYFRINTNHVRAFWGGGLNEEEWKKIFSHYFNLVICREILLFIEWHRKLSNNDQMFSSISCDRIAKSIRIKKPCDNFELLLEEVESIMYEFQAQINNISSDERPSLSLSGDPIKLVTEYATSLLQFNNKMFYILLDEYENLFDYQQICINTLIKHNTDFYTFKIGVKELGWKTRNTLNDQEYLTDPADFVVIDIQQIFNNNNDFNKFAKDVCQQRIKQLFPNKENNDYSIEKALTSICMEDQAKKFDIEKTVLFKKYSKIFEEKKHIIQNLSLLYQYFMAFWAENQNISLEDIIADYQKNKKQWDIRYDNYKFSMLFKLRKGRGMVGIQKYYAGWDTYINLSYGNIRYLMELVYRTYEKHLKENNELSSTVSPECQTIVAQEVGLKNLMELEELCKNGARLTKLILGIGRLFNVLISESGRITPEITQFVIKGNISKENDEILDDAVMHLACIRIPGNKPSNKSTTKDFMYTIHPIYAPFFIFSYRRKRKIEISNDEFSGIITDTSKFVRLILRKKNISYDSIKELPEQLDLFKEIYEND